ncbi:MAG: hypothetical protein ACYCT0_13325 [Sulfobacillus sp.]
MQPFIQHYIHPTAPIAATGRLKIALTCSPVPLKLNSLIEVVIHHRNPVLCDMTVLSDQS